MIQVYSALAVQIILIKSKLNHFDFQLLNQHIALFQF